MTLRRSVRRAARRGLRRIERRFGRALLPALGVVVALALGAGILIWAQPAGLAPPTAAHRAGGMSHPPSSRDRDDHHSRVSSMKVASQSALVPLGVYAGPAAPDAAEAFAADIGAAVPYAMDYLDAGSWQSIADPTWILQRWSGSGFRMIWGVPMLPDTGTATLQQGASGAYDAEFASLGATLVAQGQASALLVIGWDPQDPSVPWSVTDEAGARQYVAYWDQIVDTLRAVPGSDFSFVWDVGTDGGSVTPPQLYPGDAMVTIVATDAFDFVQAPAADDWTTIASAPYGPDWFLSFARRHHKPMMLAHWGVVPVDQQGAGDDPRYVADLVTWASEHHLFAAVAWDFSGWAITGGSFPRSVAELRRLASTPFPPGA